MKNPRNLMHKKEKRQKTFLTSWLGNNLKITSLSLLLTLLAFVLGGVSTAFAQSAEGLPRVTQQLTPLKNHQGLPYKQKHGFLLLPSFSE